MRKYALRRCLLAIPTLIGLSLLTFSLSHLAPGDPIDDYLQRELLQGSVPSISEIKAERKRLRLDNPVVLQYTSWVAGAIQGDLGRSYRTNRPVTAEIRQRFPITARLAIPAAALAILLALPLALLAARYRNRLPDQILRVMSLGGASIPSFWLALLLIGFFAVRLKLVPVAGVGGVDSMVLPILTLALPSSALLARFLRSELVDAMSEDYVRTAKAKGLHPSLVLERHALRNSLASVVNIAGNLVGRLFVGAVIAESIFAWPGLGTLLLESVNSHDYPLLQGCTLYAGILFVALNIIVDLLHARVDPRIQILAGTGAMA